MAAGAGGAPPEQDVAGPDLLIDVRRDYLSDLAVVRAQPAELGLIDSILALSSGGCTAGIRSGTPADRVSQLDTDPRGESTGHRPPNPRTRRAGVRARPRTWWEPGRAGSDLPPVDRTLPVASLPAPVNGRGLQRTG